MPLDRLQLATTGLAVVGRLAYAASMYLLGQLPWLNNFMGLEMRTDAAINVVAAGVMGIGMISRLPALVVLGGVVGLLALLQPVSGAGWQSALMLPWVTSFTVVAVLVTAVRIRRELLLPASALLVPYAASIVAAKAWAAIDFAIAAFATLLVVALLDIVWRVRGRTLL